MSHVELVQDGLTMVVILTYVSKKSCYHRPNKDLKLLFWRVPGQIEYASPS